MGEISGITKSYILVGIAKCHGTGAGWRYQSEPELSAHFRGLGLSGFNVGETTFFICDTYLYLIQIQKQKQIHKYTNTNTNANTQIQIQMQILPQSGGRGFNVGETAFFLLIITVMTMSLWS